jgi:hypothetical protein
MTFLSKTQIATLAVMFGYAIVIGALIVNPENLLAVRINLGIALVSTNYLLYRWSK